MEDRDFNKIKSIIAQFIKIPVTEISNSTVIDKSVLPGSVVIHRMYALLAQAGYPVRNQAQIHTYSDLLAVLGSIAVVGGEKKTVSRDGNVLDVRGDSICVGIDIENIGSMPVVGDFRGDSFYNESFSPKEISYCIAQQNPLSSFAGKFAAKEAIVKAENKYLGVPFNKIEILNNSDNKPMFDDYGISISHTDRVAIAIAVKDYSLTNLKNKPTKNCDNCQKMEAAIDKRFSEFKLWVWKKVLVVVIFLVGLMLLMRSIL